MGLNVHATNKQGVEESSPVEARSMLISLQPTSATLRDRKYSMKNSSEIETSKLPALLPVPTQSSVIPQETDDEDTRKSEETHIQEAKYPDIQESEEADVQKTDTVVAQEYGKVVEPQPGKTVTPKRGRITNQKSGKVITPKSEKVVSQKLKKVPILSKRDELIARLFQERCRQLNISIFYQDNTSVRSLGFTSAIHGEGKSLLSVVTANLLANDSNAQVTLIDCNWEHPSIHEYYDVPARPGLAEWLRRECQVEDILHHVGPNLTAVPAGDGRKDALRLLAQMRKLGLEQMFESHNDLLVVDLPPVATTAYGQVAASLLDAIVLVVHAGVTPDIVVEEACSKLKNVPVQGIILNQFQSHIPRWLRQIL